METPNEAGDVVGSREALAKSLRSLALRQIGLSSKLVDALAELDAPRASDRRAAPQIALIAGTVDTPHPVFDGCRIRSERSSGSSAAADHATFGASILVASRAARHH